MKEKKPYQERVENVMFILLGKMYDKKTKKLSDLYHDIPDAYQDGITDAAYGLLDEEWIRGEEITTFADKYPDITNLRMTQKGREWYQAQIQKNAPKWKKILMYVGETVLDKSIDAINPL